MVSKTYKKSQMKKYKSMSEKELVEVYNEANLIISKTRGMIKSGQHLKDHHGHYKQAIKRRSRVLTVMNQNRHERNFRQGVKIESKL